MGRKKVLFRGMKIGVLLSIIFLLTGCSSTMEGSFERDTAKEFNAYGITCYAPKDWAVDESQFSAHFEFEDSFAGYDVSFAGECDEQQADTVIKELVQSLKYYDEKSLEEISVDGCSLAYNVQGEVISDSESTEIWYDRFILCKGALIKLHGVANKEYFDKGEFDKIYDACDFSECEQLKLESISAEYEGELEGGDIINEESENINVTGTYSNGAEDFLVGWTIKNPKKLQWGKNNEFTVEYGDLTCKLSIPVDFKCYDGYDDIVDFSNFSGIEEQAHSEDSTVSSYNAKKKRMNYYIDYRDGYEYKLDSTDKSIVENYLKQLEKNGYRNNTFEIEGQTYWYYAKGDYGEDDYMEILFDLHELMDGSWKLDIYLDIQH